MKILVTGGAGYIGSHTVLQLLQGGHEVVVMDNLVNSKTVSLDRVQALAERADPIPFHEVDCLDAAAVDAVFTAHDTFDTVIHFAALKAVGESVREPLLYYSNNIQGTLNLCKSMSKHGCKSIIFSSSATVYGTADVPTTGLNEDTTVGVGITNPYGKTKYMIEEILRDVAVADAEWKVCILRYFNPVGAHESGQIGEDPNGIPNNLMPYMQQVAIGKREFLSIYADPPYDTADGTGVRDYIHVVDLAAGHVAALKHMNDGAGEFKGAHVFNLGSGVGLSVKEMLGALSKACGKDLPSKIVERRVGDLSAVWADPAKAERVLGWKATKTVDDMAVDAWRWQSGNPDGFV